MTAISFSLGSREIGGASPPFVIAEAGVNHNGDLETALRLVDAAVMAGADAVKFQTFNARSLTTVAAERAAYQRIRSGAGSQLEMLRSLELDRDDWVRLVAHSRGAGIMFLSTPFDAASVELLGAIGVPALKIGSGDLTNALLLRVVGAQSLPVILSTGMGTLGDVEAAVQELIRAGTDRIALLHCTSAYPAELSDLNLRAMDALRARFHRPVGLSDHSQGSLAAVAAVARDAAVIEKHLTLDRGMPGPDHDASLDPRGFKVMVDEIHDVWNALGDGSKHPRLAELDTMRAARRSLVAARALPAGHVLEPEDLEAKRPGTGISPMRIDAVLGRSLAADVEAEQILDPGDLRPVLEDS